MPAHGNLPVQEGYFSGADNVQLLYRIVGNGLDRLYVADPSHQVRARGDTCSYTPQALRRSEATTGAAVKSLGHWNFQSMLQKIAVPALVIEGERTNVPLDATETWARWLRNARLLLIPNAGHMNWLDQPEVVISSINDFFRGRQIKTAKILRGS